MNVSLGGKGQIVCTADMQGMHCREAQEGEEETAGLDCRANTLGAREGSMTLGLVPKPLRLSLAARSGRGLSISASFLSAQLPIMTHLQLETKKKIANSLRCTTYG